MITNEIKPEPENSDCQIAKTADIIDVEILEPQSEPKNSQIKIINKYYIVSLVLANVVEQSYLFNDLIDARNKFVDMCREFSLKWRETDIDMALEQEFWRIENGSININSPVCL